VDEALVSPVTREYVGVTDGLDTWEITDADTGELLGSDQTAPSPGGGEVLGDVDD
jgi:hypothetical protein